MIQTYETRRPSKSGGKHSHIIYVGTICTYDEIDSAKREPPRQKSTFEDTDNYYKNLFAEFLLDKDNFLKDKRGRELFSVSEIAETMGVSVTRLSRHMDDRYFAVFRGAKIYIKSFSHIQLYGNAISLKNHVMWASATVKECNAHLDKFRVKS